MSALNKIKKRSQVTLFQVVAEKIGVSTSLVSRVASGNRNNAIVTQELEKLNTVIEDFKAEPIQENR